MELRWLSHLKNLKIFLRGTSLRADLSVVYLGGMAQMPPENIGSKLARNEALLCAGV